MQRDSFTNKYKTEHKWKTEFSDTNFEIGNLADVLTDCFSLHQCESASLQMCKQP